MTKLAKQAQTFQRDYYTELKISGVTVVAQNTLTKEQNFYIC
jgi:hypothetical protein